MHFLAIRHVICNSNIHSGSFSLSLSCVFSVFDDACEELLGGYIRQGNRSTSLLLLWQPRSARHSHIFDLDCSGSNSICVCLIVEPVLKHTVMKVIYYKLQTWNGPNLLCLRKYLAWSFSQPPWIAKHLRSPWIPWPHSGDPWTHLFWRQTSTWKSLILMVVLIL